MNLYSICKSYLGEINELKTRESSAFRMTCSTYFLYPNIFHTFRYSYCTGSRRNIFNIYFHNLIVNTLLNAACLQIFSMLPFLQLQFRVLFCFFLTILRDSFYLISVTISQVSVGRREIFV